MSALWWVDIHGRAIKRFDGDNVRVMPMPERGRPLRRSHATAFGTRPSCMRSASSDSEPTTSQSPRPMPKGASRGPGDVAARIMARSATVAGNWGFVVLVCLLVALVQVKGRWRTILLPPTLYLASFVWETRLAAEPAITRQLMIGAILIVMMNARPQGLLGQRRVEVIT